MCAPWSPPGTGTFAIPAARSGEPVPLLQGPGGVLALVAQGRGTVVLLASSSPLAQRLPRTGRQRGAGARPRRSGVRRRLRRVRPRLRAPRHRPGRTAGVVAVGSGLRPAGRRRVDRLGVPSLRTSRRTGVGSRCRPRVRYVDAMATLLVDASDPTRWSTAWRRCASRPDGGCAGGSGCRSTRPTTSWPTAWRGGWDVTALPDGTGRRRAPAPALGRGRGGRGQGPGGARTGGQKSMRIPR